MSTDAIFLQGSQHTICQDYATARGNAVCIADGCSSSPDTDIGARIAARAWLETMDTPGSSGRVFGAALNKMDLTKRLLRLPQEALDATTWLCALTANEVRVLGMGDGTVIARKRTGEVQILDVTFTSGAPLYLSYFLDLKRLEQYFRSFPGPCFIREHVRSATWEDIDGDENERMPWTKDFDPDPFDFDFSRDVYDLVLICTDGLHSFQKRADGLTQEVPFLDVVRELLNIKVYEGEFIARRVRRMLKTTGWTHYDDFTVGGIYLGEAP